MDDASRIAAARQLMAAARDCALITIGEDGQPFNERSPGYVTVIGSAGVIDDPGTKQERWLQKWTPFYPGGAGAAVLFEVIPRGIVGDPQTWASPSADISR